MTPGRPLAVVDIDGVVADVTHRLVHLGGPTADWDAFFAGASADPPLPDGVSAVHALTGTHDVAWLSGRPERLREVTCAWLAAQGLPHDEVHLRPDHDRRPAAVLKAELLGRLVGERTVALVLDDDPVVVAALRRAGWPVALADWAPLPRTGVERLSRAQGPQGRT